MENRSHTDNVETGRDTTKMRGIGRKGQRKGICSRRGWLNGSGDEEGRNEVETGWSQMASGLLREDEPMKR